MAAADDDVVDEELGIDAVVGPIPGIDAEIGEAAGVCGAGERGAVVDEGRGRAHGTAVRCEGHAVRARVHLHRRRALVPRIDSCVESEGQRVVVGGGRRKLEVAVVGDIERAAIAKPVCCPGIDRVANRRIDVRRERRAGGGGSCGDVGRLCGKRGRDYGTTWRHVPACQGQATTARGWRHRNQIEIGAGVVASIHRPDEEIARNVGIGTARRQRRYGNENTDGATAVRGDGAVSERDRGQLRRPGQRSLRRILTS